MKDYICLDSPARSAFDKYTTEHHTFQDKLGTQSASERQYQWVTLAMFLHPGWQNYWDTLGDTDCSGGGRAYLLQGELVQILDS